MQSIDWLQLGVFFLLIILLTWFFLGVCRINVLRINLALDKKRSQVGSP